MKNQKERNYREPIFDLPSCINCANRDKESFGENVLTTVYCDFDNFTNEIRPNGICDLYERDKEYKFYENH